jgi:hypothetical protein
MTNEEFIDYYEVLEISSNANSETIERVFRYLAHRYHPDTSETSDGDRFNLLVEAYETLRDPESRAHYDVEHRKYQEDKADLVRDSEAAGTDSVDRLRLLSLFYAKRRRDFKNPGLGLVALEQILGCPAEILEFHVWYLREKGWVERQDCGLLAISAAGVDEIEANGQRWATSDRLITHEGHEAKNSDSPTAASFNDALTQDSPVGFLSPDILEKYESLVETQRQDESADEEPAPEHQGENISPEQLARSETPKQESKYEHLVAEARESQSEANDDLGAIEIVPTQSSPGEKTDELKNDSVARYEAWKSTQNWDDSPREKYSPVESPSLAELSAEPPTEVPSADHDQEAEPEVAELPAASPTAEDEAQVEVDEEADIEAVQEPKPEPTLSQYELSLRKLAEGDKSQDESSAESAASDETSTESITDIEEVIRQELSLD